MKCRLTREMRQYRESVIIKWDCGGDIIGKENRTGSDNDSAGIESGRSSENEERFDGNEKKSCSPLKGSYRNREKRRYGKNSDELSTKIRRIRDEG